MTNCHDAGQVRTHTRPKGSPWSSFIDAAAWQAGRTGRIASQREPTQMGIVSWIVVGAIAGFLANLVMGSSESLIMMVVLGIVGGLVGGFVASSILKIGTVDGINLESIAIATVGAIVIVFLAGMSRGRRGISQS